MTRKYILIVMFGLFLTNCINNSEEIDSTTRRTAIKFSYDKLISGYEVKGMFCPFDNNSETGSIQYDFYKDGIIQFSYYNEHHSNYNTVQAIFDDKDFKGWDKKKEWVFTYPDPEFDNIYFDSLHPWGYHTPFQFLDVDFDGEDELIISDYYRDQGGNGFKAYKIDSNNLKLLYYPPFNHICNLTDIDFKNKVFVAKTWSGAWEDIAIYYKKSDTPSRITMDILDFIPNMDGLSGRDFLFGSDNTIGFAIDSVHWHIGDYYYDYDGNKWKKSGKID